MKAFFFVLLVSLALAQDCDDRFDFVTPARGPFFGTFAITLSGVGFLPDPDNDCAGLQSVRIGNVACPNLRIVSDSSATCDAPATSAGIVNVTAFINDRSPTELFEYVGTSCGDGFVNRNDEECEALPANSFIGASAISDVECTSSCTCVAPAAGGGSRADCLTCSSPPARIEVMRGAGGMAAETRTSVSAIVTPDVSSRWHSVSTTNPRLFLEIGVANCASSVQCPGQVPADSRAVEECFYVEVESESRVNNAAAVRRTDIVSQRGVMLLSKNYRAESLSVVNAATDSQLTIRFFDEDQQRWRLVTELCDPSFRDFSREPSRVLTLLCRLPTPTTVFRSFLEPVRTIWSEDFTGVRGCRPPPGWVSKDLLDLNYRRMIDQLRPRNMHHIADEMEDYVPSRWCFDPTVAPNNELYASPMDVHGAILWAAQNQRFGFPEDVGLETRAFSVASVEGLGRTSSLFFEFDSSFVPGPGASASVEAALNDEEWTHVTSWASSTVVDRVSLDITNFCSVEVDSELPRVGAAFCRLRLRWRGNGQFGWLADNFRVIVRPF